MIKLKIKYRDNQTDLRFPCTEKEMNAALERIHAEDVTPLELYVSEVIFPEELGCLQDRFVNLDEVNYLGKRMDSFFGDEEYQFYEAMKLEGFDTLPDLINLSFNLNRYPLIKDISDMGKIGREYLLTVKGCLPADDADDPKYAEFGRELIRSGKGVFTEHGLLFVDEDTPFQKVYDGQNFPAYVYEEMLCFIRAEYNGKTEFLYLPCEEEAIDKAFARLGAPTPDDVELSWEDICIENEKWTERFKEIAAEEGVYELNRLTAAVNSADMDMEKLWAVAEYGKAEDAKTRPAFDGYKAVKYSRKYLAEHEAELADYRAAKATMAELLGGEKLPKMDVLKEKRRQLAARKKALYLEYRKAQQDMRELVAVKGSVDHLRGLTDSQRNKEQAR